MGAFETMLGLASTTREALDGLSLWTTAGLVFVGTIALLFLKGWWDERTLSAELEDSLKVGEVTLEELAKYDGRDPFMPILLSVRGTIYDVTTGKDFYGPGDHLPPPITAKVWSPPSSCTRVLTPSPLQAAGMPFLLERRLPEH